MGRSRSRSRSNGSRGGGGGGGSEKIQKLVDERQYCRRNREFDQADKLRDELQEMGINVNDTELTWRGPDGLSGSVDNGGLPPPGGGGKGGGKERRDGDWDCPECGAMVFASKEECFKCGAPKGRGGGRGRYDDDRRGGGRGRDDDRRSSRYDDDRRGGRYDDDRRGGRDEDRRSSRHDDDRRSSRNDDDYDRRDRRR